MQQTLEDSMIYFLALIPATVLSVAGYFVLYLAHRSEGAFRAFGKYLGFWAFALAGLVILGAIFAAAHGGRHGGMMGGREMEGPMHRPWAGDPRTCGSRLESPNTVPPAETQREASPGTSDRAPNSDPH
jgi:hypothetical protein